MNRSYDHLPENSLRIKDKVQSSGGLIKHKAVMMGSLSGLEIWTGYETLELQGQRSY
jgi:hypothetical protein